MYIIVIIVINAQSPIDNFIDMGRTARNIVRSEILFGNHRPLAKATIAHRKEAGISLTIPLIESGRMRNALSYMIDLAGHRIFISDKVREIIPAGSNVIPGTSEIHQRLLLRRKVAKNWIA